MYLLIDDRLIDGSLDNGEIRLEIKCLYKSKKNFFIFRYVLCRLECFKLN